MKCVKLTNGPIRRLEDNRARYLVGQGKATFISKDVWKKNVRGPVNSAKHEGRE